MCWGIINIVLGIIPPVFRHLLAMFKFKGEREYGLALLWSATAYKHNIYGAIAGLVASLYTNIGVSLADIKLKDAVPEERIKTLHRELRQLYPDSQLWRIEESRVMVANRNLDQATQHLTFEPTQRFDQLTGLRTFEKALDLMFLHRFEDCAVAFIDCIKLNAWSHGMYYYNAAACNIEMYRNVKATDPEKAKAYAVKAKEYLEPCVELCSRKALMGRQLPFDAFICTKIAKGEARAKARKCDIIDVVGVSPIEEMSYFWTGYRRSSPEVLKDCLARLSLCESSPGWKDETVDEKAALAVLQGTALRCLGKFEEAKAKFERDVFCYTPQQIKSCPHAVNFPLPVAHYETAVCIWQENGGEDCTWKNLQRVNDEIEKCYKWEHYELEDRMVVKLAAAKETLAKCLART